MKKLINIKGAVASGKTTVLTAAHTWIRGKHDTISRRKDDRPTGLRQSAV